MVTELKNAGMSGYSEGSVTPRISLGFWNFEGIFFRCFALREDHSRKIHISELTDCKQPLDPVKPAEAAIGDPCRRDIVVPKETSPGNTLARYLRLRQVINRNRTVVPSLPSPRTSGKSSRVARESIPWDINYAFRSSPRKDHPVAGYPAWVRKDASRVRDWTLKATPPLLPHPLPKMDTFERNPRYLERIIQARIIRTLSRIDGL